MRWFSLALLISLAACAGDPKSYGITGPATPTPPPVADDATIAAPGSPTGTAGYGPGVRPTTGNGRFWGYN